jgi:long-chain acyl-CoA synthetase
MHLTKILTNSAQQFGSRPALTMRMGFRTITMTYTQVQTMAQQVALFLADKGVKAGDTVVLCAPNSPLWICVWWGCVLQGAYVVPLSPLSTTSTLLKIIAQTNPVACFASQSVHQLPDTVATYVLEQVPSLVEPYGAASFVSHLNVDDDDQIAEIMYTSGTTGDPKGVLLSHRNLSTNLEDICHILPIDGSRECLLSILPLSHVLEQTIGFLLPFSLGAQIVYAHSHGSVRDLIRQYHITKIVAVPEFLKLMAARIQGQVQASWYHGVFSLLRKISFHLTSKRLQRLIFFPIHRKLGGRLDTVASGGAPLDVPLEELWNSLGVYVLQGYGLTETSPVITMNTFTNRRYGSVGKPLAHVEVRLGEGGEIEVHGDSVTRGYYKNEAKTKESFTEDGWFKTGDMGELDADGYLFIRGRRKYMIKGPGAENIFPEDIEEALNTTPGVRDSCVIGRDLPSGMVEVHAVLLLADPSVKPDEVVHVANQALASYQHVTGWSVWPNADFPRSITQKVKKEEVITWVNGQAKPGAVGQRKGKTPLMLMVAQISGADVATIGHATTLGNDLKFDSLMRVELVTAIEERFGVLIDERLLNTRTTVDQVQDLVNKGSVVLKVPFAKHWPRSWWARGLRVVMFPLLWLMSKMFFSYKVRGLENLENVKGPILLMPNHVSLLDGLLLMMSLPARVRRRISFAAGFDVLYGDYRWAAWLVELCFNAFPFPRKEGDHVTTGLLNMGSMLDEGYNVVMFPEGQLSPTGQLIPLKRGAGLVAVEMGVPVVPVYMAGVDALIPYDHLIPRHRGTVTVTFGQPITCSRLDSVEQAVDKIAAALQQLAEER